MSKNRLSRDQKRKAKLAQEAQKRPVFDVKPYEGERYRADAWLPLVYETELGVYEVILASHRTLANRTVQTAYIELVRALRGGLSPKLRDDEPEVLYTPQTQRQYIVWNIRRHWGKYFENERPVATEDLIGIVRTLLYSIEVHAWNTGPSHGYVDMLYNFMQGRPPTLPWDLG